MCTDGECSSTLAAAALECGGNNLNPTVGAQDRTSGPPCASRCCPSNDDNSVSEDDSEDGCCAKATNDPCCSVTKVSEDDCCSEKSPNDGCCSRSDKVSEDDGCCSRSRVEKRCSDNKIKSYCSGTKAKSCCSDTPVEDGGDTYSRSKGCCSASSTSCSDSNLPVHRLSSPPYHPQMPSATKTRVPHKYRDATCPTTTRKRKNADRTMCSCCVTTMMGQPDISYIRSLMDAALQVHTAARRCCIAFATYCCPSPEDCGQFVDEQKCCPNDDNGETFPLLDHVYGTDEKNVESDAAPAAEEVFTLEVGGMDCPDCLNKVRKAFGALPATKIRRMDYVRGLVEAERTDPAAADPETIGRFVARVSGFTIRVIHNAHHGGDSFVLPVCFARMPPADVLASFDIADTRHANLEAVFVIHRTDELTPRALLARLEPYDAALAAPDLMREGSRINADLGALAIRRLACALLTIPILVLVWAPLKYHGSLTYRAAEFALATGVFVLAAPIYTGSLRTLWYLRQVDLGVLTTMSTITTYAFSVVAFGFQAAGHFIADPFFETLGLLVTLIYFGRTIQASTRKVALGAIGSLAKLQPTTAVLLLADGNAVVVDGRLLFYGDIVRVNAGEVVPTDGVIFSGIADIDESAITGESVPVTRTTGQSVHAGTTVVGGGGSLEVSVLRLVSENSLASVIRAVMDAQGSGSRFADLADRLAAFLLPLASAVALASFLVWLFVSHYVRKQLWGRSVIDAVSYAIAVMAVSCPCALTLAVPTISATCMAMGVANGVVFRSSEALLKMSTIQSFAFDKTGTLSLGTLSTLEAHMASRMAAQLTAHMTAASRHPVSVAVNQHLVVIGGEGGEDAAFDEITYEAVPGGGLRGEFYGYPVLRGSAVFTGTQAHPIVKGYIDAGLTVFVVTVGNRLVAALGLADKPRPGAERAAALVPSPVILSGDHQAAVSAFAARLGVTDARGALLPTAKAAAISQLQTQHGSVVFVGDGVNDSVALTAADIGIAMGSGTDAAVLASEVVLVGSNIGRMLASALTLGRIARATALAALTWCGVYFIATIVLASGAAVNFRIPPQWAGLGEVISVAPIVGLALVARVWGGLARRAA